ncbi:hypothetical protein [Bacillus badius]|uniref:Uncharacterized protein n=1 Tax=Bacillus badius TaxID=1455 RepID=A0ABR5AVR0_BACBA|nr:hypothetical protein [Bacillus badius]KIL76764.1 hypothetical protein SD78_0866 [Bacillus badius]KIL78303.1 hypothetical protein SD77_3983 [Bacillus badius]KZR57753.1 hypothetical protein A3781_02960 [Bacillus badius]MED4715834.1 hypothetical protein [Bacillus badius]
MVVFASFHGTVTAISDFATGQNGASEGCYRLLSVQNERGETVHFVVAPATYFVDQDMVSPGDQVTGYYDQNAPVPLIYPPQYRALIVVKDNPYRNVKVDYFNQQLTSSDGLLKLNPAANTKVLLTNGQAFSKSPANRNLIVIYGPATKSIPAQTAPYKIIVWC